METVLPPVRLADDALKDVWELVHYPAGDVLVTGINSGFSNKSVRTCQPVIKCLDGQGQNAHFGIGDGNSGNDLVVAGQMKCPLVFRHFQHQHFVVQGELNFTGRVKPVFQDLGQDLHVIDGRITIGEHRTQSIGIEPTKEGFSVPAFLFNPVVEITGLQFSRASGQVGIRHPQTIGQETLSTGCHFDLLAGHPHAGQAIEFHFLQRDNFVEMIGGLLMTFVDYGFEGCDSGHDNVPFG